MENHFTKLIMSNITSKYQSEATLVMAMIVILIKTDEGHSQPHNWL